MFRPITVLCLFLALALTTTVKANDYAANCDGWSVSGDKIIDDQPTYILVEVKLLVLEDGDFVPTGIEEAECVIVPSKHTPWEVSGNWGADLEPGTYQAQITNSQFCEGDHSDKVADCEAPEGYPCYQPYREIEFTCEDNGGDDDDDCNRFCCKRKGKCYCKWLKKFKKFKKICKNKKRDKCKFEKRKKCKRLIRRFKRYRTHWKWRWFRFCR